MLIALNLIRTLLFLLLTTPLVLQAEIRDPAEHFFNDTFGDFSEEIETARDEGKKGVLIMFEMDDCPFCARMKSTVLNQSPVQEYYREHFLIFPLDIEGSIEIVDFAGNDTIEKDFAFKQHRVRATPVFIFFDLDGNRIARYTGATSSTEEFLMLGEYVVSGRYQQMSFNRYKQSRINN